MTYLKNTWYVAAWATEMDKDALLSRKILDQQIVLFRDEHGKTSAIHDRCSHRFSRLSTGKLENGCVACPYHGLVFNGAGHCVHNPHGDGRIPRRAHVRAFPTIERYFAIWIWMGNPDNADESLIPVFDFMQSDTHYVEVNQLHIKGNYQLENDNILDLSHIEFVHPMFSSPAVSKAKVVCEVEGDRVWSKRDIMNDNDYPEFIGQAFQIPQGKAIDRWLHVWWQAPSYMGLLVGGVEAGKEKSEGIVSKQAHWFTPETKSSTHYFFAISEPRSNPMGQEIVAQSIVGITAPFEYEDKPLIENQELAMEGNDFWDLNPIILAGDTAGVRSRNILKKMIEKEKENGME